jgi:hypothetical protein
MDITARQAKAVEAFCHNFAVEIFPLFPLDPQLTGSLVDLPLRQI